MIFSSYPFLLQLLPLVWVSFLLCRRWGMTSAAVAVLLCGSTIFYVSWSWHDGALLLASIVLNHALGRCQQARPSRRWLILAIVGNLSLLLYYKYAGFLLGFLPQAVHWQWALPLGISFFTFQQMAWHVDLYQRRPGTTSGLARYALFVLFFPQLIAGPIVHARNILPRLRAGWLGRPLPWTLGVTLLCMGLAKKVLLADSIAPGVDRLFGAAASGQALNAVEVLTAAFGYGLQLYFDFSGYGDMAVGLGLMFGIRLPTNFRAPYRSSSIVDFWRRWHITLSAFLRDYLYVPLGGGHSGRLRQAFNLMLTMLLGGLWHGAGWQFVLWGGIHGLLLGAAHAWRRAFPPLPAPLGLALTTAAVMLVWIPFRANSLAVAMNMYRGLLDWSGPSLTAPASLVQELPRLELVTSLPWALPVLLVLSMYGRTALQHCLALRDGARGLLAGGLLILVLKTLAERPDRAFLYFNF